MTVLELTVRCKQQDGCEDCADKHECHKYQDMIDCINLQRPDMLNTCIDYLIDLYHSKANLSK